MPGGGLAVYSGRCAFVFFAASAHLRHRAHTEGKEGGSQIRIITGRTNTIGMLLWLWLWLPLVLPLVPPLLFRDVMAS